jgi:hypothetical protein
MSIPFFSLIQKVGNATEAAVKKVRHQDENGVAMHIFSIAATPHAGLS